MIKRRFLSLIAITILVANMFVGLVPKASALSGSEFQAGRIIDDAKFFDANTMSAADIHNFLVAKVPNCDIWGLQRYSSTQTRAQYSASRGYSTPFICLKDFRMATPAKAAEPGMCNGLTASGDDGAAGIIYRIAQSCGINPQVLLVLLQKEQTLVTDDWPWPTQYRSATGYGCPDTAPCDSEYYGFFNQVYMAARQFKRYAAFPNNYNYRANANNYILYNPNASCGGSTVYIQNQATAGLYNYTPYQPNASALNNLYGSGDSCGAYGNRNFWRMFNDWFGSPIITCDAPPGTVPAAANLFGNGGTAAITGNWTSTTGQGFAYLNPNRYGGFELAVMAPGNGNVVWQGVWWNQTNPNIGLWNTIFIPVKNSSGLTDLYYATSTNWSKPGFTVGLMRNDGHSLTYAGTKWAPTNLSLDSVSFIPGNFLPGSGDQGFATVIRNNTGGFDVSLMAPSADGLVDQGVKWNQTNGAIARMNTVFIPSDYDKDGYTDLYYATSTNWSVPGFTVGLMHNDSGTGFSWAGTQWTPTNLNLGKTSFLPGNWTGPSQPQSIAYATSCGNRGFNVSVMTPGNGTLDSKGVWWQASTVQHSSTALIPADHDGDGYTDIYYTSPIGNNGFDLMTQRNTNGNGFSWNGIWWSPRTTPLHTTLFLPSK
jgi:hypothetical protein